MQSGGWIALLHQIPKSQHGNLVFTTVAGLEIAVQAVLRIEADYVLVRGRQTGVTDGGGFFFIPYERVLFMGFQKVVKESVIRAIYGESAGTEPTAEEPVELTPSEEPTPEAEPTPVETPVAPPAVVAAAAPVPESAKPSIANKAALLERLRARRNDPLADVAQP